MTQVALGVLASGPAADAVTRHVPQLVADRFASKLFAKDATLWGPEAESESAVRLSWVSLWRSSRPLVGEVAALRDHLAEQGVDHVVLCGMGGSSLAPEVICATAGVELTVLDSSNPDYVRTALCDRLDRAVVVVSSKSGSTVETDSQRRAYESAFTSAGIDPTQRIVVVTDPGSPLDKDARAAGYRVINADPHVGGRYSALTAFGLVPSGLAGVDLEKLLDEAESVADLLADDDEANPALRLGAVLAGTNPLRDKLILVDDGCGITGFADWAEQLIAESTGKNGTGVLPVVVAGGTDGADNQDFEVRSPAADITVARLVADVADTSQGALEAATDPLRSEVQVSGSWALSCCCGRSPRPLPAGSWASTPSTSPMSRAPRRPPAGCSTPPTPRPTRPLSPMAPSRCALSGATGSGTPKPLPALWTRCSRSWTPAWLRGDHGLSRPARRRSPVAGSSNHRRPRPAPHHVRLGATLPALNRAVPQGRSGHRRLSADHRSTPAGPGHPGAGVHLRRLHHGSGRRRRAGAGRPRSPRPAVAPDRPRRRPGPADPGLDNEPGRAIISPGAVPE